MKIIMASFLFIFSLSTWAFRPSSMTCVDAQLGASELKMVISDLYPFFYSYSYPREQRPSVEADFIIKGTSQMGVLELPSFMPDWQEDSGRYKATPSWFDFSLCHWKKCPVRNVKMSIHTLDQLKGEGTIKYTHQVSKKAKEIISKKLNCEIH